MPGLKFLIGTFLIVEVEVLAENRYLIKISAKHDCTVLHNFTLAALHYHRFYCLAPLLKLGDSDLTSLKF